MRKCFSVGVCDVDYHVQTEKKVEGKRVVTWRCPYHQTWLSILRRCYSEKQQERCPTYKGCSVDERWHKLSEFKLWIESQPLHYLWKEDNQNFQVDKDFLFGGNKVYGPDSCVILPVYINGIYSSLKKDNGEYPLGVSFKKKNNKFQSLINSEGKRLYLGLFDNPMRAHRAWQLYKVSVIEGHLDEYEDLAGYDKRVSDKIDLLISGIRSDIVNSVETKF